MLTHRGPTLHLRSFPSHRFFALALAMAVFMFINAPARAATTYHVATYPPKPSVGEPAIIEIGTFSTDTEAPRCAGPPVNLTDFPWRVEARSPSGDAVPIEVRQSPGDQGNVWRGDFTFSEAGKWTVGLASNHWGQVTAGCEPYAEVTVLGRQASPATAAPSSGNMIVLVASLLLLIGGIIVFALVRLSGRKLS